MSTWEQAERGYNIGWPLRESNKNLVLAKKKAVVLNISNFTLNEEDIINVSNHNTKNGLYEYSHASNLAHTYKIDIDPWPRKLRRTNLNTVKSLCKKPMDFPRLRSTFSPCHPRKTGNTKPKTFYSKFEPNDYPLEVVHSDLRGKLPKNIESSRYYLSLLQVLKVHSMPST